MADTLTLGPQPTGLTVLYVVGDPWTAAIDHEDPADTPAPWPAAPSLEFDGITWTATLSAVGAVANARATWTRTEADVAALHAAIVAGSPWVRLSVNGVTYCAGHAVERAVRDA